MAIRRAVILLSLCTTLAQASVSSWQLAGLEHSPVGGVDMALLEKIQKAAESCQALSEHDSVELISDAAKNRFTYPWGERYYPMQESEFVLERSGNGQSYQIRMESDWGFDLPMPMLGVMVEESEHCNKAYF